MTICCWHHCCCFPCASIQSSIDLTRAGLQGVAQQVRGAIQGTTHQLESPRTQLISRGLDPSQVFSKHTYGISHNIYFWQRGMSRLVPLHRFRQGLARCCLVDFLFVYTDRNSGKLDLQTDWGMPQGIQRFWEWYLPAHPSTEQSISSPSVVGDFGLAMHQILHVEFWAHSQTGNEDLSGTSLTDFETKIIS